MSSWQNINQSELEGQILILENESEIQVQSDQRLFFLADSRLSRSSLMHAVISQEKLVGPG